MKKITILFALFVAMSGLSSCKKSDADTVAEAQACLDKSTASTVDQCVNIVSGLETEAAYLIRCSAAFIYQDFTSPTRLANIAEQMKGSGASATTTAIGLLAFGKPSFSAGESLANTALTNCTKAKSKGMILLSAMSLIASTANALGSGAIATACDSTQPGYTASNCESTTKTSLCAASSATVGAAAQTAYQQSCLGSNQQDSSICSQFAQANQGAASTTQIGDNVKQANNCP